MVLATADIKLNFGCRTGNDHVEYLLVLTQYSFGGKNLVSVFRYYFDLANYYIKHRMLIS